MTDDATRDRPVTRLEAHFGDRVVRCFTDRPASLYGLMEDAVRRRPQGEAVVCGERRHTWTEFQHLVLRVAGGLVHQGVQPGDRVALLLGNDVEFVAMVFATAAIGAITVPLSTREQTAGLTYILQHCGATVLVHEAALAARLPAAEHTPALRRRVSVGGPSDGAMPFEALTQTEPLPAPVPVAEEDVATLLYTSGTTGFPKGAMLTHLGLAHSAMHFEQGLALREGERAAVVVPLSHVTGLVAVMLVTVRVAGTVIVCREFKARDFLALAANERMSYTVMVPAMYSLCLLEPDFERFDLTAWRTGAFGGAPMAPATIDALAARLPSLGLSNCYGATETTSPATITPPAQTRAHIDSVGQAVTCCELAIMDDAGCELPAGEVGEVWIKGPMVAKGYWNNPQATAANIVGGFWRSGDVGRLSEDGYLQLLDRQKDMLIRGGFKIYSVEVENTLCQHPAILEAAVVARPCPVLGERVHVFVSTKQGRTADAPTLRAFCAERLADYKVPETYTLSAEPLPRNANGKLMKRVLREQLLATLARDP